jgi:hypothetical protein
MTNNLNSFNKTVLLKVVRKYIPDISDNVTYKHSVHLINNDKRLKSKITTEELYRTKIETEREHQLIFVETHKQMIEWVNQQSFVVTYMYKLTQNGRMIHAILTNMKRY